MPQPSSGAEVADAVELAHFDVVADSRETTFVGLALDVDSNIVVIVLLEIELDQGLTPVTAATDHFSVTIFDKSQRSHGFNHVEQVWV
jgi:hypothetical protein